MARGEEQITDNIDHLSYSMCKKIYRKGIDYALGTKLGVVKESFGKSVDVGTMAHAMLLGGDPNWVVSPFDNYRTAEARTWRDSQDDKTIIITETEFEQASKIADAVKNHPLAKELLQETSHEVELTATVDDVKFVGYADLMSKDRIILADLKTTAQFDDFKWKVFRNDYDIQASVYKLFGHGDKTDYYFIVAESVEPYRVQVFGTSKEFIEKGNEKLDQVIGEYKRFRNRPGKSDRERLNFNIGETNDITQVEQLGDWSY